jgi:hypothetical protein
VLAISIFPLIYSLTTSFLSYRLIPSDFRAQNLHRRAMQHRSLPNECRGVRLGLSVTAHECRTAASNNPP